MFKHSVVLGVVGVCGLGVDSVSATTLITRSGTAADVAGITPSRDQFRADLGGGATAGANGSFGGLRREINWDGVPAGFSAPNLLPANFFNVNSPRGAVFSGTGASFMVSSNTADAGAGQPAAANFGNIDPSYTSTFNTFSPQRLFTSLGNNQYDVTFFVPGTTTPALVRGFGAIFCDVDQAGTTAIQFFDANNTSLGAFAASPQTVANGGFSFLGAFTDDATSAISRVTITAGNAALASGVLDGTASDVVALDDFLYAEPVAVPEPSAGLIALTLAWAMKCPRRRGVSR